MPRPHRGVSPTVLVLLVASLAGCAGSSNGAMPVDSTADQRFGRDELVEDVAFLFHTIEAVHPNPYFRADPAGVARARGELESGLRDGMTRLEFWRRAAPVVSQLGDGHTRLPAPREEWNRVWSSGHAIFPLVLDFDSTGAVVRADLSSRQGLPPGTRVLAINDVSTPQLIAEAVGTLPYERPALKLWALNRTQASLIHAVRGWEGPFRIEVALPSGQRETRTMAGLSSEEWTEGVEAAGLRPAPSEPFTFRILADGALGYLELRSFTEPEEVERFLEPTFRSLLESPPCALVLDLRHNAGGSSDPGDRILGYLTDRPVRQYSRIDVRASAEMKEMQRASLPAPVRWLPASVLGLFDDRLGSLLGSPDGTLVSWVEEEEAPGPEPLRWNGTVYALVGLQTFSAAADLAAALQDYELAEIVGEETGGLASSHGDSYTTRLPHTRLRLDVSPKFFVRPSGVEEGSGVVPEIRVPEERGVELDDDPAIRAILERVAPGCDRLQPRG